MLIKKKQAIQDSNGLSAASDQNMKTVAEVQALKTNSLSKKRNFGQWAKLQTSEISSHPLASDVQALSHIHTQQQMGVRIQNKPEGMTEDAYAEKLASEIHQGTAQQNVYTTEKPPDSVKTHIKPMGTSGPSSPDGTLDSKHGSFATDEAKCVLKAQMQTGRLFLTVQWKPRPDGFIPQNTVFSNSELKRHSPLILCEFYEKMLKVNLVKQQEEGEKIGV